MAEILMTKQNMSPVIILSPDGWRRPIPKNSDLILPLSFKAPMISKYTKMGEKLKKKSKKEIYPLKLAEFFKQHSRISLAPPSSGDYKGLIANIRILMKQGVSETKLLRALTMVPAKLLGIDRFAGTLAAGKLANLFISNKKIFEDKAKITLAFVEGREFNIPKASDKLKPPAGNISGNWIMKIESPMGNVESQLSLSQDNNQLEGKMTSAMLGSKEIENGIISGKEISWTITANMMGTESVFKFSAKLEDKVIKGQISLGSYGDATFVAKPKK